MGKGMSALSRKVQQQIAQEGMIVGTVAAVRATVYQILEDSRFRTVKAVYGENKKGSYKPGKEPGTPYKMLACGGGPTTGSRSAEESARRTVDNSLITIYCADTGRRQWRTPKVHLLTSIEVYTGRRVLRDGELKAEKKEIPIRVVRVA